MKTPYRYLIGIGVGIIAGIFLPTGDGWAEGIAFAAELSLRVGRYLLLPLIFFSLPVAITQLRREKALSGITKGAALAVGATAAAMALIGTALAWLVGFGRIPVIAGSAVEVDVPSLQNMIRSILNLNLFQALTGEVSFLLPLLIPAFLLGWHLYHDREIAEPTYNLFDSLSRLIYRANRYVLTLMPGFLAILSAQTVMQGRGIVDFARFLPMLGMLSGAAVVIIFGAVPLVLWLQCGRRSPWKTLAGLSGAFIGAFVSGSPLFNYGNVTRHLKENIGIPRKSAAFLAPVFMMFSRGGTALIASYAMLTIVRSYSSLEITLFQAAWTALFAFFVSFALPASPDKGLAPALVMLTGLYGRGLDSGWHILAPLLPLLTMLAALLDSVIGSALLIILNHKSEFENEDAEAALRF